jgi:integrase
LDLAGERFRIRNGKTAAARRWVPMPPELLAEVAAGTPADGRTPERRVFQATPTAVHSAMRRACQSAGIARFHPHDLRHRWISIQVKRRVPITESAAAAVHRRTSVTWDIYSHVMLDD